jgi:hypothetical protein
MRIVKPRKADVGEFRRTDTAALHTPDYASFVDVGGIAPAATNHCSDRCAADCCQEKNASAPHNRSSAVTLSRSLDH